MEIRTFNDTISVREEGGQKVISGYAAIFNQRSRLIAEGGKIFYEIISPGAFDKVINDPNLNCIACFNHEKEHMLARTKSNTLMLEVDDIGLRYSFSPPDNEIGKYVLTMIERGDIYESSFKYSAMAENIRWEKEDGQTVRYVDEVYRLYDVSPVVDGAFANTDVTSRQIEDFEETLKAQRKEELSKYYRQLQAKI